MEYIIFALIIAIFIAGIALYVYNNIARWRFNKRIGGGEK
jgi:hypothetical protein